MGRQLISLKGNSWRGTSRLGVNDRGQKRFLRMENCYISSDGQEIRAFPGYATMADLSINTAVGLDRYVVDAVRPIFDVTTTPDQPYKVGFDYTADSEIQTMVVRALPVSLFGFEQIGDEILVFGESRFREAPIYNSLRVQLTPANVAGSSPGTYTITMSNTVWPNTSTDATGAGLNGLHVGDAVYLEGITVAETADQAIIDATLDKKVHKVTAISGSSVTLSTDPGTSLSGTLTITAGEMHKVRPNRSDNYSTSGNDPYSETYDDRPDDPNALTVWRLRDPLSILNVGIGNFLEVHTAFVANRQRDFGDDRDEWGEGIHIYYSSPTELRGVSRREQRKLPYRPNVEAAKDRVILAAPGYGCMFQIPGRVPVDYGYWPSPQTTFTDGVPAASNNLYDRPRSLGIPKPRLIEGIWTPPQPSPSASDTNFDISVVAHVGSPSYGLAAGDYKFAISYVDSSSGEEGVASEPITVTIPAFDTYAYTIAIHYLHPGYVMPECLADRINVYIAPPGEDAMAFYCSLALSENPYTNADSSMSGIYGFDPTTPTDRHALWRRIDLPILNDSDDGDISAVLDPTRLAPQSATMPRGAEACRFIRGVLFAGGSLGNSGPAGQLWSTEASATYDPSVDPLYNPDEIRIAAHSAIDAAVPGSGTLDGTSSNGTLGIAGRCFPDAYQGIEFVSEDLLPNDERFGTVDRVLNRRVQNFDTLNLSGNRAHHFEILKLLHPVFNRGRIAGASPSTDTWDVTGQNIFYMMPRGQLQIGDPGAPWRSSRAFIKVVDPNRGDDITAIGHLGGSAIVCTRRETFSYSWYRNPGSDEPNLMSNEFGCIAGNSMVEFDGGVAWISDRGPVALGQGLQFIGQEIADDFNDSSWIGSARYSRDSKGMMRHAWGCHDASRGLVMWGLITTDATHTYSQTVELGEAGSTFTSADDETRSRFPCNEVLIWSYRANAFTTWRPPAGHEIYWMRPMRDDNGNVRICFLAADRRIYGLEDTWCEANSIVGGGGSNESPLEVVPTSKGSGTTFTSVGGGEDSYLGAGVRNVGLLVQAGMYVEFLDRYGNITGETTIASVTSVGDPLVLELATAQTWGAAGEGVTVRIGGRRRIRLVSNYIGAETMDTMSVDAVQMRYTTFGNGSANAKVKLFKIEDGVSQGEDPRVINMTRDGVWEALGRAGSGASYSSELDAIGRRKRFANGKASAPEIAVQVEIAGEAQVRIQDIAIEVG